MVATQLSNSNSVVIGGHVTAYDASGAQLFAYSGAPSIVATKTALQAVTNARDGQDFQVQADGSNWRYVAASVLTTDAASALVLTATGMTAGAFLRTDTDVDVTAAVAYTTADAAVLWTVPVGFVLQPGVAWQHVTTSWTGGSSSAIGASSSGGGATTKGDILGGSGGDVAAGLLSTGTYAKGTVGAKIGNPVTILVGGDTIKFDRITSVFTAGAGVDHFPMKVLLAPTA